MLNKIANLHKLCFPDKPWDESEFASLKRNGCEIIASENGFIVYRTICDETEIITIGVAPDSRGGGIGDTLLAFMERDVKSGKIFLEVAENNEPAKKLYERNGYTPVGVRPNYYDGKTNAIILQKILDK